MRPSMLDDYLEQSHILRKGMPLRVLLELGCSHSMIFWEPLSVGKKTQEKWASG
ncbi:MAG: hypothetical protein KAG53_10665 [Endozoicomonadaceae bacterium]|nr:hypothetical protein [Endozoicomonadaceae bacterium]